MSREIIIDPITRIEGHSKITIQLGDDGSVTDARFHVTQFRGFEKMIEGRPFYELPFIMGRICGICTISHELASAKATDAIMAVQIPPTAAKLRRIVNYASLIQSHALSFFYLSSPDFLLGMDSDPVGRSIFGLAKTHPEIARDGVRLRRFGQEIIEWMAGKRLHPSWIAPGGVTSPLEEEVRDRILSQIPEIYALLERSLDWFKAKLRQYEDEIRVFANFNTMHLALVDPKGRLELYDGVLRLTGAHGNVIADDLDPTQYQQYLGEAVEPWTFMKFPYYKPMGYPAGLYRVGSLSRLIACDTTGTPRADRELGEFNQLEVTSSFHNHLGRLIECMHAVEAIEKLLHDGNILDTRVQAQAGVNSNEGVGVTEAPRGTLVHHYRVDDQGRVTWANMVVATTHNNLAMNRGVLQTARRYITGDKLTEGALNRVEAVIRTFDPCLSCSTHADNQLALAFELVGPNGQLLDTATRG